MMLLIIQTCSMHFTLESGRCCRRASSVRRNAGEPLSNQDLVGWVQVGVQHVPRAEDIPIGALVCINVAFENRRVRDAMADTYV